MMLPDWVDHDDRHSSIDLSSLGDPNDRLIIERPWSAEPFTWWCYFQSNGVNLCATVHGTMAEAKAKSIPALAVRFSNAAQVMVVLQKEAAFYLKGLKT